MRAGFINSVILACKMKVVTKNICCVIEAV